MSRQRMLTFSFSNTALLLLSELVHMIITSTDECPAGLSSSILRLMGQGNIRSQHFEGQYPETPVMHYFLSTLLDVYILQQPELTKNQQEEADGEKTANVDQVTAVHGSGGGGGVPFTYTTVLPGAAFEFGANTSTGVRTGEAGVLPFTFTPAVGGGFKFTSSTGTGDVALQTRSAAALQMGCCVQCAEKQQLYKCAAAANNLLQKGGGSLCQVRLAVCLLYAYSLHSCTPCYSAAFA